MAIGRFIIADVATLTLEINSRQAEAAAKRTEGSLERLQMSAKQTGMSFEKLGRTMRNVGVAMTAAATVPILMFGRSAIKAASDAQEAQTAFDATFKNIRETAQNTANSLAQDLDLARSTSVKLFKQIGDQLTGVDFSQTNALAMSEDVIRLSADLASFHNIAGGTEDVVGRLTKAMLGETESLKAVGIVIRQDTKEFKNMVAEVQRATGATLLQAKSQVIFREAVKQSKNAIGDYARTSDNFANRVRVLGQRWIELKESIGEILIVPALKAINFLISAVDKFTGYWEKLPSKVQQVLLVITSIVAAIGPLMAAIGALVLLIAPIAAPFFGVIVAIAGIIAHVEILRRVFGVTWAEIGQGLLDFGMKAIGFVVNFRKNWSLLTDWLSRNWENMIVDLIANIVIFGKNLWENIKIAFNLIGGLMGVFGGWFLDNWQDILNKAINKVIEWAQDLVTWFFDIGKKIFEAIKAGMTGQSIDINFLDELIKGSMEKGTLQERIDQYLAGAQDFIPLTSGFQSTTTPLPEWITEWLDFFQKPFVTPPSPDFGDGEEGAGIVDSDSPASKLAGAFEAGSSDAFKLLTSREEKSQKLQSKNLQANQTTAFSVGQIATEGIRIKGVQSVGTIR